MPDLLDLTARKVRHDRGPIHHLDHAGQDHDGRVYTARCGAVLSGASGAFLTTRDADCRACSPTGWKW